MSKLCKALCVILVIVGVVLFLYLSPIGIRIGYLTSGGSDPAQEAANVDSILRQYEEQVAAYNIYRDSDNPTVRAWADKAKARANALAAEYNAVFGELILEEMY